MKKMPVIWLLCIALPALAQQKQVSFAEIDDRVKSIAPASPARLAYMLTKDYGSEKEKLRAIFSWITDHIAYRVKRNYTPLQPAHKEAQQLLNDTASWKSGNDVMAEMVLQDLSAFCDGYARLFKTLCDYAGLRSAIISGFAQTEYGRQGKFRSNHSWNAVCIDSVWRLLDVTWASGYTNYSGDQFVKRYDETYFLPAPEDFIRDHYPDDLRWALMEKPAAPPAFKATPYKNKAFTKYHIALFQPQAGIIEAAPGDTIHIVLETSDPQADSRMTTDTLPQFDSAMQKILSTVVFVEPVRSANNSRQWHYAFCVDNSNAEWLQVIYNHEAILRYQLKVKKDKPGSLAKTWQEKAADTLAGFW